MELKINKEFYNLIPNLSQAEASSLVASLRKAGCRHPIITWKGMIIDGHNRYAICKRLGIPFETIEHDDLEDEYEVQLWMIENQLARRNLPIESRMDLAYRFKQIEAQKAKERQGTRRDLQEKYNISLTGGLSSEPKGKSLERVAQKASVSKSTAERYDAIQRKGSEEQKASVRKGEKKIGTVYKEIQGKEKPNQQNATSPTVSQKDGSEVSAESAANENVVSYTELKKIFKREFEAKYLKDNGYKYWFVSFKPEERHLMEITNCSGQESLIMYADCLMGVAAQQNSMTTIETARSAIKEMINEFSMLQNREPMP